ncbi:MAG: hypothetical protein HY381_01115 [Candidatus Chisholmbacteria bacterium]|nr:hypothetical protein [Candidatus Chisholmbacteria bacterium]
MKVTQQSSSPPSDINQLIQLLTSAHLLEEKTRVSLYLPKAVVKVMDALAQNKSRSELVKDLIVKQVQSTDPYGTLAAAQISDADIDEITQSWDKYVDQLVDEL